MEELLEKARKVREAWDVLRNAETRKKNDAIRKIARKLDERRKEILEANRIDVENARARGVKESLVDRLALNDKRIDEMIKACETVISLKDPVGEVIDS